MAKAAMSAMTKSLLTLLSVLFVHYNPATVLCAELHDRMLQMQAASTPGTQSTLYSRENRRVRSYCTRLVVQIFVFLIGGWRQAKCARVDRRRCAQIPRQSMVIER